jgi:NodT family efflux transporter outer membrane factor (OMF) lipoprotein
MRRIRTITPLLALILTLISGCAQQGPQREALPMLDANPLATQWAATGTAPDAQWWKAYGDAQLDALITQALASNPNIETYEARVHSAEALAQAAGAAISPGFTLSAEAPYERTSKHGIIPPAFAGRWEWQPSLTVALNYELDFWGRNRAGLAAAISGAEAARFEAEDVRLQLITALVTVYTQLDHGYTQYAFAQTLADARAQQLKLNQQRLHAGLDSALESEQTTALLAQARAEVSRWQEQIEISAQQLALLAGQGPDFAHQLQKPTLAMPQFGLPSSLPADLLGRRPDLAAARARIAASLSQVEASRAGFYPNINLTAFAGLSSYGLGHFLELGSLQAGVTPAISLPIIDSQRLRADLAIKSADRDSAIAAYNGALVEALRQVAEPLTQLQSVEQQRPELARATAASQKALGLARLRYEKGLGNYLPVIVAEAQWVTAQRAEADLDAKARTANANLAKAVGGGWSPPATPVSEISH